MHTQSICKEVQFLHLEPKRSFKKCGINVNKDGSENALVHIEGISGYFMPEAEEELHMDTSSDEGDLSDGAIEENDDED